jgi:hypothetical protein
MAIKSPIPNPMDNLFEQMVNITKASAYDILVDQVKELKAENETLKGKAVDMTEGNDNDKNPLILFLREETDLLKAEIIRLNKSLDEVTLLLSRT